MVLKYANKSKFTFSGYLTSWPQMTFDLDLWPLTTWTYKGFHIISINQVWFKSDFNFSNEAVFTFSAYLSTWPQITFDLGTWPLTSSTNEVSHVACMAQLWLKSMWKIELNVNPFHGRQHQQTTDNSPQSGPYVSFLQRQATC